MEWKFEKQPAIRLYAIERRFNEETAGYGIPAFYKEYREKHAAIVAPHFGICKSPDENYDWIYAIGDIAKGECPEGFSVVDLPERNYCIFYGRNAGEINGYIYGEWFLTGKYEIVPGDIIEVYDDNGNVCEIHVPCEKMDGIMY